VNNGSQAQLQVTLLADPSVLTTPEGEPQSWPQAVGAIYSLDLDQQIAQIPSQDTATFVWPFEVVTPSVAAQIGVGSSGVAAFSHGHRFWQPVRRLAR
jgi:hypothetical protein